MSFQQVIYPSLAFILLAPVVGLVFSGYDRVLSSRMQGRQGPPFLQPLYDIVKLFNKEATVVNRVQTAMVIAFLIFSVFTGCIFFVGSDLLLVFFALTLAEVFLMLAACSTNSPYSSMGSQRELLSIMAYEPMTLLTAIGFYMISGSFNVSEIINRDVPAIVELPGMFAGFVFILIIKFRKSPFDLSTSHHAHQEMVKGVTQDISGNVLGIMELAELYETVLMMAIVALFFITKNPFSYVWAVLACFIVYFILILIDNVFPRVKWEKMLLVTWGVTFALGGANLLILDMIKIAEGW
ncbi:MAG: NADH-quinone oxidoreductase subunit H [Lachnospiraceae bacterium]|nr:NADH-quinone oxidoreductase subunit H [Lachnospiraceae bacterium]